MGISACTYTLIYQGRNITDLDVNPGVPARFDFKKRKCNFVYGIGIKKGFADGWSIDLSLLLKKGFNASYTGAYIAGFNGAAADQNFLNYKQRTGTSISISITKQFKLH